jgi:eukaryotic-like serine/threonine-protein kinase
MSTGPLSSELDDDRAGDLFLVGDVLAGVYEIRCKIGEGGMGQVFEAYDRTLGRRVAIKAARRYVTEESVRAEARALAALHHVSAVTVHGLGEHAGIPYVVMERVQGQTLEAYLARWRDGRSRLPAREVVEILAGIADGLAAVHRAGMAHRDVKPANVMLAPDNRIVLTDFGIFRSESDLSWSPCAGSPLYMAPEAINGGVAPGEQYLVDVYSLGIVAYEMLTGHVPYDDTQPMRVLLMHLHQPVPDPREARPDTPPALAELVGEMLAKDPQARPQGMDEVAWRSRRVAVDHPSSLAAPFSAIVAEDNPATAVILASLISAQSPDAEVRVAGDGVSALHMVRSRAPDLLVTDLHLPAMSGVELCVELAAWPASESFPVLCTSACASASELRALQSLRFVRFVPKGEPLTTKLPALLRAVQRRAMRRVERRHEP